MEAMTMMVEMVMVEAVVTTIEDQECTQSRMWACESCGLAMTARFRIMMERARLESYVCYSIRLSPSFEQY